MPDADRYRDVPSYIHPDRFTDRFANAYRDAESVPGALAAAYDYATAHGLPAADTYGYGVSNAALWWRLGVLRGPAQR